MIKEPATMEEKIWQLLAEVSDPEIPVLSVTDLGIVREVNIGSAETEIVITPTYSGCPAMQMIEDDILKKLTENGFQNLKIRTVLTPAWTTDWIPEKAKEKLRLYGIAPPEKSSPDKSVLTGKPRNLRCPRCQSNEVEMISQFGSTACKALYRCLSCREPFDYFKCF